MKRSTDLRRQLKAPRVSGADVLIIGGGVAGLSAAAALAPHAKVTVLEAEEAIGFHSSGRSATMLHYALGDRLVRALTLASRSFFESPPENFAETALGEPMPVLVHARADEKAELDRLDADIIPFAKLERLDADGLREECPLLRTGPGGSEHGLIDRAGLKLDGNGLLQGFARQLQRHGGELRTDARIASIEREGERWKVETERGESLSAGLLVNAAGAWADRVAETAGVRPLGIRPMRRTIIVFDAPDGTDVSRLPFTKTIGDELYFGQEAGRIFASPMDEIPTDPCDAQPDEYEMALAAHRVEERTNAKVERIVHRWAGLRSFAPDRHPVVGFDPDAEGFFWLAGQGGAGLQSAPAVAEIVRSLIIGGGSSVAGVDPEALSPARLAGQPA